MKARVRWGMLALWLVVCRWTAPLPAAAHDQAFSYADLAWHGARVELHVSVHRDDAAPALGVAVPESLMHTAFLSRHADSLARYVEAGLGVDADGAPLALRFTGAEAVPGKRAVRLAFEAVAPRPVAHVHVEARLFPANAQHQTFLNAYADGRLVQQAVLTASQPAADAYGRDPAGTLAVVRTFVAAGVHHIFIGPDHILFIVGLLLLGGGLARVLKVATAFTLAHSITLALAATGTVSIPSRVVEPLIALSIVYIGIETLRSRGTTRDRRTPLAFAFGLVHGLGFASVLREFGLPSGAMAWSLVAFNVGVEAGQACIVLAVMPALALLRASRPAAAWRTVAVGAWGIIAAGGFWFVQRLFTA